MLPSSFSLSLFYGGSVATIYATTHIQFAQSPQRFPLSALWMRGCNNIVYTSAETIRSSSHAHVEAFSSRQPCFRLLRAVLAMSRVVIDSGVFEKRTHA